MNSGAGGTLQREVCQIVVGRHVIVNQLKMQGYVALIMDVPSIELLRTLRRDAPCPLCPQIGVKADTPPPCCGDLSESASGGCILLKPVEDLTTIPKKKPAEAGLGGRRTEIGHRRSALQACRTWPRMNKQISRISSRSVLFEPRYLEPFAFAGVLL
jgi:hypothetical protein